MSRDINGNYTLPVGNPVVAGTIITAAWGNTTMNDVALSLTDSLSRTGLGGMQAALRGIDGVIGAPAYSWTSEPTSGWYRKAAGSFWFSVGGVDVVNITSSGITAPNMGRSFGNRLINGGFRIDQINEGAAYTATGAAGALLTLDGWTAAVQGSGEYQVARNIDPDRPTQYCATLACTVADAAIAAGDFYTFYTSLEGWDAADLKAGTADAETITLSFAMKSSVAGDYGIWFRNAGNNRTYIGVVTQITPSVREEKTVTLTMDTTGTWDYTGGVGTYMGITLAAGATYQTAPGVWSAVSALAPFTQVNWMQSAPATMYIGRIQLEKGSRATAFTEISFEEDYTRCQRYYQKANTAAIWRAYTAGFNYWWLSFATVMRGNPVMGIGTPGYSPGMSAAGFANVKADGAEVASIATNINDYMFLAWTANARMT